MGSIITTFILFGQKNYHKLTNPKTPLRTPRRGVGSKSESMTEQFNPLDFISVTDYKKADGFMEIYVRLLREDVILKVPEELIEKWAESSNKLVSELDNGRGEIEPFDIEFDEYYIGEMPSDNGAVDQLAIYILKYHYEACKWNGTY